MSNTPHNQNDSWSIMIKISLGFRVSVRITSNISILYVYDSWIMINSSFAEALFRSLHSKTQCSKKELHIYKFGTSYFHMLGSPGIFLRDSVCIEMLWKRENKRHILCFIHFSSFWQLAWLFSPVWFWFQFILFSCVWQKRQSPSKVILAAHSLAFSASAD